MHLFGGICKNPQLRVDHGGNDEHQADRAQRVEQEQRDQRGLERQGGQTRRDVPARDQRVDDQVQRELNAEDLRAGRG
jgi:hypothetical protein